MSVSTVQQVGLKSADNASLTLSFASPTVSGHEVRVTLVGNGLTPPPASFSDSLGNVYSLESPPCQVIGFGVFYTYVCAAIVGGPLYTITVTGTGLAGAARELIRSPVPLSSLGQIAASVEQLHTNLNVLNTLCANGFSGLTHQTGAQ